MAGALTDEVKSAEGGFLQLHKDYLDANSLSNDLLEFNKAGIERFESLKFPHPKHEMFTFVNTREIASTEFALNPGGTCSADVVKNHVYACSEQSCLVLVDGVYQPELSDLSALAGKVELADFEKAFSDEKLKQSLVESLKKETDVFSALNAAFAKQGVFLKVLPKAQINKPIQVLLVSTGAEGKPAMSAPRFCVHIGKHAEVKIIVKTVGDGNSYFSNTVQDYFLDENSSVIFSQVQADSKESWNFSKTFVRLNQYSRFKSTHAMAGSKLTRNNYQTHLCEPGAELTMNGVSVLVDKEQVHQYIQVNHHAPNCISHQYFKNIVNDKSRASFDGTVVVDPGAQLTQSDQLINNLMLSDEAHADGKPNLMIYADDVKCAHGNTVGQIDDEQLFYLETRGLSASVAKTLLTTSFARSIIDTVEFPEVVEDLKSLLLSKLERNHA